MTATSTDADRGLIDRPVRARAAARARDGLDKAVVVLEWALAPVAVERVVAGRIDLDPRARGSVVGLRWRVLGAHKLVDEMVERNGAGAGGCGAENGSARNGSAAAMELDVVGAVAELVDGEGGVVAELARVGAAPEVHEDRRRRFLHVDLREPRAGGAAGELTLSATIRRGGDGDEVVYARTSLLDGVPGGRAELR